MRVEGKTQFIQQIRPGFVRYSRVDRDKDVVDQVTCVLRCTLREWLVGVGLQQEYRFEGDY